MEMRLPYRIDYFLTDADGLLGLSSLLRLFQESAIRHADARGFGGPDMARKGWGWVLYKIEAEVRRYPRFDEEVEVVTRLGGWKGMKAYRHFELRQGEESLASSVSAWFLIDAASRRPLHLSEDVFYSVRSQPGFPPPVPSGEWKPGREFTPEREFGITLRWSDIDTNGHVNNTAYVDFLETALAQARLCPRLKDFKIQYNHEINREAKEIRVALSVSGAGWRFRIAHDDTSCAVGQAIPWRDSEPDQGTFG